MSSYRPIDENYDVVIVRAPGWGDTITVRKQRRKRMKENG
jgi:hypothetical protein